MAEDCAVFGIPLPPGWEPTPPGTDIWACHVPALAAFLSATNQWRLMPTAKGARFLGLDYAALDVAMRNAGITLTPDQWSDFRVIERAATAAMNGD